MTIYRWMSGNLFVRIPLWVDHYIEFKKGKNTGKSLTETEWRDK